jgi:hypothetical protein
MDTMKIFRAIVFTITLLTACASHAKYCDDETDLLYYGHRYYNPTGGRWLSRDPIGDQAFLYVFARPARAELRQFKKESLKPAYLFSGNNPENLIDNKGLNVYKVTLPSSASGSVDHREIVADDGTNGCYILEFYPKKGKGCRCFGAGIVTPGEISVTFLRKTSANDYIKEYGFNVATTVDSSNVTDINGSSADAELAAKAAALSQSDPPTYVLLFNDCGTIANSWIKSAQGVVDSMRNPNLPIGGFP